MYSSSVETSETYKSIILYSNTWSLSLCCLIVNWSYWFRCITIIAEWKTIHVSYVKLYAGLFDHSDMCLIYGLIIIKQN